MSIYRQMNKQNLERVHLHHSFFYCREGKNVRRWKGNETSLCLYELSVKRKDSHCGMKEERRAQERG